MPANPFSAHLGYLFTDLPLEARFGAARQAGFEAVEHPSPFQIPADRLRALLSGHGLVMAQITSGMGAAGEKGIASLPGREAEFRDGFARALDYAEAIGCPLVHVMAGTDGDTATYRVNLEVAVRLAEGRVPRVLIEAISHAAVPGYVMSRVEDLLDMAAAFPGQIGVLVDSFHAKSGDWDPAAAILAAGDALAHVHVADAPGRHEPGSGDIDFAAFWDAIARCGYRGAIGFEYLPSGSDNLSWLPDWRERRACVRSSAPPVSRLLRE